MSDFHEKEEEEEEESSPLLVTAPGHAGHAHVVSGEQHTQHTRNMQQAQQAQHTRQAQHMQQTQETKQTHPRQAQTTRESLELRELQEMEREQEEAGALEVDHEGGRMGYRQGQGVRARARRRELTQQVGGQFGPPPEEMDSSASSGRGTGAEREMPTVDAEMTAAVAITLGYEAEEATEWTSQASMSQPLASSGVSSPRSPFGLAEDGALTLVPPLRGDDTCSARTHRATWWAGLFPVAIVFGMLAVVVGLSRVCRVWSLESAESRVWSGA
jgi:hypothetical protein